MGFLLEKCRLVKVDGKILESCCPFTCGDDDLNDFFLNDAMRYKEVMIAFELTLFPIIVDVSCQKKQQEAENLGYDVSKSLHTRLMYFDLKNLISSDID